MEERPKVGVGVIIIRKNKVLLGRRKGSHGSGSWCPPGGHLEFGERIEDCARREVFEEAGIKVKNIRQGSFTNDFFKKEKRHYVTLHLVSDYDSGKVVLKEPDKFEKWEWFSWNNLPRPLFLPMKNLLKQKYDPFR